MILTITLTPALDKTVVLPGFSIGQVNRVTDLRLDPGGKGINVSKVLKELGSASLSLGILGGGTGQYIRRCLDEMGLSNDFIEAGSDTRTNLKIIDPVSHTNTDINEPGAAVDADILEAVYTSLMSRIQEKDSVVLAGKLPPGAPDCLYERWGRECRSRGARVFLDADGLVMAHGLKAQPFLIKPNLDELERVTKTTLRSRDAVISCCQNLIDTGIAYVVVSLGKDGALFVSQDLVIYGHGLSVPVGSTVGAGDSMMAAMVHGFALGLTFSETAALSIAVSAANVMCSGTQAAPLSQIEALISQVKLDLI